MHYNRRHFLGDAGKGLFAGALLSPLTGSAENNPANVHIPIKGDHEPVSVQLSPTFDPTELKEAPFPSMVTPDQRVGFCIVGIGRLTLGQILPAFSKSKYCKPVALVSGDPVKAGKVASQYGIDPKNIYDYQNFDRIKDNPAIDVVYIVLPNSMHEEFVIRSAKAGKDVLCEKPMTTSSASATRMIAACKQANKKLMIAYRIQYEPHNSLLKEWTRTNEYGKVKIIESFNGQNQGDPNHWRLKKSLAGGGPLPDVGIYCINTIRSLTGQEPDWVSAYLIQPTGDPRFKEVEESIMFQMHFPSGLIAYGGSSYGVHKSARYRCFTDAGSWYGMDPAFPYSGLQIEMAHVKGSVEFKPKVEMEQKNHFALEMDHFAECVIKNQPPFTPGEEGLQDQLIMEAMYQSAKEGKPVSLKSITSIDTFRGTKPSAA